MKFKTESTAKRLERLFGGKWRYHTRSGSWENEDGNRYVCRVLTGRDFDGEYTGASSMCMYYRDGSSPPKWV